jgi:hypothetical protein
VFVFLIVIIIFPNMSNKSICTNYDEYIPNEQVTEESHSKKTPLATVLLFAVSAIPSAFSFQDSLWCELAWFEVSQPEGTNLPAWIILMQSAACVSILCLLFIESRGIMFPKVCTLYVVSCITLLTSVLMSFFWHFSLKGVSVFILVGAFVGQFTAWMQQVFVIPWFANNYNPRLISAFATGNVMMVAFLVSLELVQEPGAEQIFSPTVYYAVASVVYAGTIGVCVYTFNSGIGMVTVKDGVQPLAPWRDSFCGQTFTPVFWETKMLNFGRLWMVQMTWTVVPLALPYAAESTTNYGGNDGENFLQWAIAMGYFSEFFGSATSYIATKKYWITESIVFNTIASGVIVLAAYNIGDWSSWWMRTGLILAVGVTRFAIGWATPMIPRELSRRYPAQKELLVRSNALWCLYGNVIVRVTLLCLSENFN